MRLIVTRPEPDATRTAQALIRLGHTAILSPALDIVLLPRAEIPVRAWQAVLVTSANALRALIARPVRPTPVDVPLLTVGDQTALEAKRGGFAAVRSAGGALADLVALAKSELDPGAGPLLYAAGEARAGDLADALEGLGFEVETAAVYRAEPVPRLAEVARAALSEGAVDGVLAHSRRSAAAFALALRTAGLAPLGPGVTIYALSEAAAAPLRGVASGAVRVAARPDQIALFAEIGAAPAPD